MLEPIGEVAEGVPDCDLLGVTTQMPLSDQVFRFLSSTECSHQCDDRGLCGTRSTWSYLSLSGPTSFERVIVRISRVAPRLGFRTPRRPGGELLRQVSWLQFRLW